ncbi:MAG: glycerophosphodiester phosphodiesterase [Candidatus Sulfotelmatobacter sp.]
MVNHPLLLGHRGVRSNRSIPENTLAAFDLALAEGCDGFELDVRLSHDGHAVICHNPKTRRMEIASRSALSLRLPLLQEVLQRYRRSAFLDIELKIAGLEAITAVLLRKYAPTSGFVVSSFLPECLTTLRMLDSSIPLGLICENEDQLKRWRKLPVQYVIPHHKLVRSALIDKLKSAQKKILVWTVNHAADMKRFSRWGVDGLISDSPRKLIQTVGRTK